MIDPRLLSIKREFLLEKHKECEALIMQDKFSRADVEKLQGYYNMCEEYAGFFYEFTTRDVSDLKEHIKKILTPSAATLKIADFKNEVEKRVNKKLEEED